MRYDPTLLAGVAEAMARTAVVVQREVQALAAVSFGISNRLGSRLPRWPLRRPLRHRSSSSVTPPANDL